MGYCSSHNGKRTELQIVGGGEGEGDPFVFKSGGKVVLSVHMPEIAPFHSVAEQHLQKFPTDKTPPHRREVQKGQKLLRFQLSPCLQGALQAPGFP